MKILLTGGSGFLGSHIADALSVRYQQLVIFDKTPSAFRKGNQELIIGNILDPQRLSHATRGIDVVFHLAALADINITWDNPYETIETNVMGTINVLEACRINKVKRIIFASTLYVDSRSGSLYRVSKHTGELLVKAYHERCGLEYIILRFGTLYGTRANSSNSIHGLLKQALTGKIDYYGTGKELREYIHVRDAAQICTELLGKEHVGETLILTGHHRIRLHDVLDMISEIMGHKINIKYHPKDNRAHYEQIPQAYVPNTPKRISPKKYCDFGMSLVEILEEINEKNISHRS